MSTANERIDSFFSNIFVFVLITDVFFPFLKQRRLIKMEIDRALDGHEYRHWKRELRRLYIKSAPVIRWFLN